MRVPVIGRVLANVGLVGLTGVGLPLVAGIAGLRDATTLGLLFRESTER